MNILMVVFHFPPLNAMASSRHYAFAKYWAKAGHHVTVVTPKKYRYHGTLNYEPKDLDLIELIEVDFGGGVMKRFVSPRSSTGQGPALNGLRKAVRYLRKHLIGNAFDVQKVWEDAVYKQAEMLLQERAFDFLYSAFSPPVPFRIASRLKATFPQLFWVADYRDLWSGNHLLKTHPLLAKFQQKKEKQLLQKADLIITVSHGFKNYLERFHDREVHVVYNGYDHEEIAHISSERFFPEDATYRFVYTGTIYIGTRDPAPFFEAVRRVVREKQISSQSLQIWFFGDSGDVLEIAERTGVGEYVHTGGWITKEEAYRAQRDADGILFLEMEYERGNLSAEGTIPAKLFENMRAGTEIFAVGITSASFVGKLIERSKTGKAYGTDTDAIYRRLKVLLQSQKKEAVQPNRRLIERFERSRCARRVLELVEKQKKRE